MKNIFKTIDLDQVKDKISDLQDQMQDIRFRKPWTKRSQAPSLGFLWLGAAAAVAGILIYRNRKKVVQFCAQCGSEMMDKLEGSPIKEQAGKIMDKLNGAGSNGSHVENYQTT